MRRAPGAPDRSPSPENAQTVRRVSDRRLRRLFDANVVGILI